MSAATDTVKARLLRRRNTDRGVPRELYLEERVQRLESELDELYKLKRLRTTAALALKSMDAVTPWVSHGINGEASALRYREFTAAAAALGVVLRELGA